MNGEVQNEAAETCVLASASAKKTEAIGASLSRSLYDGSVTIALTGELGAGKTTFLRGFFRALGTNAPPISPTYALEQRHTTDRGEALHLDLYRLTKNDARELLGSTDDHPGIRAVEWFDRAHQDWFDRIDTPGAPHIDLTFIESSKTDRTIRCTFRDAAMPKDSWIDDLRKQMRLPGHIGEHCDAVADLCDVLADALIANGTIVRKKLLHRAARIHDLFRFVDFRPGAGPKEFAVTPDDERAWQHARSRYPDLRHEEVCALFLREQNFSAAAAIVETHGLQLPQNSGGRITTEQNILYYADKRVNQSTVVTLRERFDDFIHRYGKGKESDQAKLWYEEAAKVEKELFPAGAP
jgi:tRNA threonylcarbamoyl adenosine modification protein YjeE